MIEITNEWKSIYGIENFEVFQSLSEKDKRIYYFIDGNCLPVKEEVKIYRKEKNIVVAVRTVEWKFARNRFFPLSKCSIVATVTPKRIFSDDITKAGKYLAKYLGFTAHIPINRTLFRQMLNKGYEAFQEHMKEKTLESFLPGPITDIKIFVEGDVKEFSERIQTNSELCDLYKQAVALDRRIKMSWSDRKIHDLHMKWTEEIHKIKNRNCSTETIWKNTISLPEGVELLNSEMRIAEEGSKMHHCIFTNYGASLTKRFKIAFHVNDFTVMFDILPDRCQFNQAYKAWNKSLDEKEMSYAVSLVEYANEIALLNKRIIEDYYVF